jgi:hypothetical protein
LSYHERVNLHRLAEERSLAYHREVARRLLAAPTLVEWARVRARGWLEKGRSAYYARKWLELFDQSLENW